MTKNGFSPSDRIGAVLVVLGIVALWFAVARMELVSPVFLPSPSIAVEELIGGLYRGDLALFTLATLEHMAFGWIIASLAGIGIGALIGLCRPARMLFLPTLEFLRPLPASSLLPIGILLLGLSNSMLLMVIAFGSIWPVLLATIHGFTNVDPRLKEVANLLHFSKFTFAVKFGLPNALPDIVEGMRLSLTVALIVAVVGEMVTGQDGLGATIMLAARSYRSGELFAGVILLGMVGALNNTLLVLTERRLMPWRRSRS